MADKQKGLKEALPIAIAVICGLVAVYSVNRYIAERTVVEEEEKVLVLRAAREIRAGDAISEDHIIEDNRLASVMIPAADLQRVHITVPPGETPGERRERDALKWRLIGSQAARNIPAGGHILHTDLVREDPITRMAEAIDVSRRAVTMPVSDVSAVGHHIRPGDHVDILVTLEPMALNIAGAGSLREIAERAGARMDRAAGEGPVTTFLMQDVIVLAAGSETHKGADPGRYSTITLDVLPREASLLVHAQRLGSITYVLRSPLSQDRLDSPRDGQITEDVIREQIEMLDVERKELMIEIIHGGRRR